MYSDVIEVCQACSQNYKQGLPYFKGQTLLPGVQSGDGHESLKKKKKNPNQSFRVWKLRPKTNKRDTREMLGTMSLRNLHNWRRLKETQTFKHEKGQVNKAQVKLNRAGQTVTVEGKQRQDMGDREQIQPTSQE